MYRATAQNPARIGLVVGKDPTAAGYVTVVEQFDSDFQSLTGGAEHQIVQLSESLSYEFFRFAIDLFIQVCRFEEADPAPGLPVAVQDVQGKWLYIELAVGTWGRGIPP